MIRFTLIGTILLAIGACTMFSGGLTSDVEKLLQQYGVRIPKPTCEMVDKTRAAFCKFKTGDLASLLVALDQGGAQPKTANQWGKLNRTDGGSPECMKTLKKGMAPRVQRGGDRLPYLVGVYYDEKTGEVCLDVEYGYG